MITLLLGIWLLLLGLSWAAVIAISSTFLGIYAIVLGILYIIVSVGVVTLPALPTVNNRRQPPA